MDKHDARAGFAGLLTANAVPHAYASVVGATHMSPLGGRASGPAANGLWAAMNVGAAAALARRSDPGSATQRRAFKAGVLAFSAWVLVSEWVTDFQ